MGGNPKDSAAGHAYLLFALLLTTGGVAQADPAPADARGVLGIASASGTANGSPQFVLRQIDELHFGTIVPDTMIGGSVIISPTSQRILSGGLHALGGDAGPAWFEVIGTPGTNFVVDLPDRVDLRQGSTSLTLTHFTSSPERTGTIPEGGRATVYVGATLTILPRTQSGRYQSAFDVGFDNP